MSVLRILQVACIISFVFIGSQIAEARDMATLQSAVTYARDGMEKAKADHEANTLAATQQQRIVEERKKQLADESKKLEKAQKDTDRAWKQYLDAQQKFDKAQSALDEAWSKK